MIHEKIKTWKLNNKRVFVRADLNVPLQKGKILNDFRLNKHNCQQSITSFNHNGSIVLATHIGRPKNNEPGLSTQLLMPWFETTRIRKSSGSQY